LTKQKQIELVKMYKLRRNSDSFANKHYNGRHGLQKKAATEIHQGRFCAFSARLIVRNVDSMLQVFEVQLGEER